ncbi:CYP97A3 [Scenedesmus sp. PABB004]|nr:CYP97A3 [Scenedesmus sp. PABB004]
MLARRPGLASGRHAAPVPRPPGAAPLFPAPPRRGRARIAPCAAPRDDERPADAEEDAAAADELSARILSGEFTDAGSTKEKLTRPVRKFLAQDPVGVGRALALALARLGREWRAAAASRLPTATGDIREIVGQPVFVPLYKLYLRYGKIFRLSFGPKTFIIISDPGYARQVLSTHADKYSKGILSEILDFVMGQGLIPADGEVWRVRRRAIVPALHKKYVASMVSMFGACAAHGCDGRLSAAAASGESVEMENFFSRLALDIIGKAVFNYEFDSLTHDDPVISAVYTALREAEYRSTAPLPYWNFPPARWLVPRQRRVTAALQVINGCLDGLIAQCRALVEAEQPSFGEEYLSEDDPSILRFLVASGDEISSRQLRDDLMTMLIAGHETTAAVLTWTFYLLAQHPRVVARVRAEVDAVVGGGAPSVDQLRELHYTTRVINEAMRLYPQPPVLIRRALADDAFDEYVVPAGSDIFISVWNLHRSPALWDDPDAFRPERFPLDAPPPNEVTEGFRYLPFGGGRRKCIGDTFALFEALTALATLTARFDFALAPDAPPVGMTTGATIHTVAGLWMTVTPRADAPPPRSGAAATAAQPPSPAPRAPEPRPQPVGAAAALSSGGGRADASAPGGKCPWSGAASAGAAEAATP